jgi:hypothetical protein
MYVKVEGGVVEAFPYGQRELKRDNPNTSFPRSMSDAQLAEYGLYPVSPREIPQPFDPLTQNAEVINPVLETDVWVQTWSITAASSSEIEQRTADLIQNLKGQRDQYLSETDWMALSDNTLTSEWASYRQALRDITSQGGFPFSVTWPTKPE